MKEPSAARKRTLELHDRAVRFSIAVNKTYPSERMNYPSEIVWNQLVRAADSASNNLVEAGNGSTDPDFLHKMRIALREAKEAKTCLHKISAGDLHQAARVRELKLEQEADELAAIFATIIINMERRLGLKRGSRARR